MTDAIAALKAEPVLTAAILAACNAPDQFRGGKILDLEAAVHRIGYRETYRIALLITFRQGLRLSYVRDSRAADYLWRLAATTACGMEALSKRPQPSASAYTIGLLHLIGCFILARDQRCAEAWDPAQPTALVHLQTEACGIAYPEAGALALETWGFPMQIWLPIRYQLRPASTPDFQDLTERLSRAAWMARQIEAARPGSPAFQAEIAAVEPDETIRSVEAAANELIIAFQPGGALRRPVWAKRGVEDVLDEEANEAEAG